MADHEIDYKIVGSEMQYVEVELDPEEVVVAEAGAMMYMQQGIQMSTHLTDGSDKNSGILGTVLGMGKRALTGENMFMTFFTNKAQGKLRVAFSAPYPGKIIPINLATYGGKVLCQKGAFLASAKGISIGVGFTKKISTGFFGGEGFILQKIEGNGNAFLHAGGTVSEHQLSQGETIYVDTGSIVALQGGVDFDIKLVQGVKSMFFSGEGYFLSKVTGPGKVWLQSMPFPRLLGLINANLIEGIEQVIKKKK